MNDQLQNHFLLASSSSSSPQTTSSCPPETPPSPIPPPSEQSPAHSSFSPPPSPSMDTTIDAIACAHRKTFLYANDKLTNPHALHHHQNNQAHSPSREAELCSNHSPGGFHSNLTNNHHDNWGWSLRESNAIGGERAVRHVTQRQSGPSGVVLVRPRQLVVAGRGVRTQASDWLFSLHRLVQ